MGTSGGERHGLYDHGYECLGDFVARLDMVLAGDPRRAASVAILVSKDGVESSIDRARSARFDVSVRAGRPDSGMFAVRLARKEGEEEEEEEEAGRILIAKAPGSLVHLAITDEPRRFVEGTLAPFIRSLYPRVSRALLSAADMYGILERLERSAGAQISVPRLTAYRRLRGAGAGADRGSSGSPGRAPPRKRRAAGAASAYTGMPLREAFRAAAANDQWIGRIDIDLPGNAARAPMNGRLARDGIFVFRHAISPFYDKALPLAARLADKRAELYSGRSRENNNGAIRPLAITLDNAMARDRSENSAFIKSIESMPHVTLSVYHSSSYVHVSIVDYMDGSSFDIWILSTRQILVVPQMRATHAAIARLVNRIFKRFSEGSVADHE